MKKRICILSHGLGSNGIDIFVGSVATGLDQSKWDIRLILAVDEDGSLQAREPEVLAAGIPIFRTCDLVSLRRILLHERKLYRYLKQHRPEVFHSNMDLLNGLNCAVAWAAGVPVRVSHSHTTASQYEQRTGRHATARLYRGCMKLLGRMFANRKCGCSENAMTYLFGRNWNSLPNTRIIHNGIDLSRFSAGPSAHGPEKRIISVGRLCEAKNPLFALEVMAQLRKLRRDFVYEWVGGGALREQVEAAIRERGQEDYVKLLGERRDIEMLLPTRDLFFLPSLFEGLSIALIEAQAAGLPCVGSDRISEVANCGSCLFLPLEAPATHWAREISRILDGNHTLRTDPEQLRKFDISCTIHQLEQVYQHGSMSK